MLGWAGCITSWNQDCQEKYQQPQICRWYHSNSRRLRGTKEPLDEGKRGEWKNWLKTQHSNTKILVTCPITLWQTEGKKVEAVADLFSLGSKITVDSDCSHKIQIHLLLGRKAMTSWDSVLKSRDITLPTKVHVFKAMVFPVVIYVCESWSIKKDECWNIDAFELWCWGRVLDSMEIKPVNPKRNQSWIFIRRTDAEAET